MVSQLEYLETLLNVDVDHMHPSVAKSLPFKPHDQTSNQLIVNEQLELPENQEIFKQAIAEYGDKGWEAVLDRMSVLFCAKNIPNIQGRVLLQTSPFSYRRGHRARQELRGRVREGRDLQGSLLYQGPLHGPCHERGQGP